MDTNLLVYAHRSDSGWHGPAAAAIERLAQGDEAWGIPWPCLHEFLGVVTHPRLYAPPTPLTQALDQVQAWLETPRLVLMSETGGYWEELRSVTLQAKIRGPRIHDARIAALCRFHGARELWSADRDFHRFSGSKVRNPLVA